jgi:glycine/D-amino acid oxidase-like deaminating enzyme
MSRYGIELYASLEKETGLATGWKQCGSLNVARTPERLVSMKRQMARAKSFGIEFEFVSPRKRKADADPAHRRSRGGGMDSRRRQGESDRSHAIARQGRAHGRRHD